MTKSVRRNSLIITIPLVTIAAAWAVFVFLPIQKAIGRLQDETEQKQLYCNRAETLLPVLKRSGRDLAEVRRRVSYWDKKIPSQKDLAGLLGDITAAAQASGLRTTRFDPEPIVAYERIAQMPLTMKVTGSFSRLFSFLQKVEEMSPVIWVNRLEIEKAGGVRDNESFEIDMVLFMDNPKDSSQVNHQDNR